MKVIQAKLKGRKPRLEERETPQSADVVDLMARLRASLEGKGGKAARAGKGGNAGKAGKAVAPRTSAPARGKKKAGAGRGSHAA
jgi:non-homologous end joining protein Ku